MNELTKSQRRALQIIEEHGPIQPREFAMFMWPNSNGWRHHSKCGPKGSHKGGGMYLAGGGYLGKLSKKGWIERNWSHTWSGYMSDGYSLTEAGIEALSTKNGE